MPVVARDLGGLRLYGWVFSGFMLGSVVGIVAAGREADRRGPAVPFVAGVVLFGAGLAIAGLAPSMAVLVAGRVLQGIGAGAVPSVAYATIGRSLPEELRARMMAVLSTAWVVPGLAGPAVSAEVARLFGWRWVFLGLLPVVAVAGSIAVPALVRLGPPAASQARQHRLTDGLRTAAGATMILAGLSLAAGSGAIPAGLRADRGRRRGRPARTAPAGPAWDPVRAARAARHDRQPGAADVHVLRRRRLRDAGGDGPAPPHAGGSRDRRHRRHDVVDGRCLGAGQAQRHLGRPAPGPGRAGARPGWHRRDGWPCSRPCRWPRDWPPGRSRAWAWGWHTPRCR